MTRFPVLVVLFVALSPLPCLAQFGGPPPPPLPSWKVEVKLDGDKTISGTMVLNAIMVECDLGQYSIKAEKIKEIQFTTSSKSPNHVLEGDVITHSGEKIHGAMPYGAIFVIETDLGTLQPAQSKLRSITFGEKQAK